MKKREPLGTRRAGQVVIGIAGTAALSGVALGLQVFPAVFLPTVELLTAWLTKQHSLAHVPTDANFWTGLFLILSLFWAASCAYAFKRQPSVDAALDRHLRGKMAFDNAQRTGMSEIGSSHSHSNSTIT